MIYFFDFLQILTYFDEHEQYNLIYRSSVKYNMSATLSIEMTEHLEYFLPIQSVHNILRIYSKLFNRFVFIIFIALHVDILLICKWRWLGCIFYRWDMFRLVACIPSYAINQWEIFHCWESRSKYIGIPRSIKLLYHWLQ